MTLLASLELTRRRAIFMRQVSPFSELWIYRREDEEEAGAPLPGGEAPDDESPPEGGEAIDENPTEGP